MLPCGSQNIPHKLVIIMSADALSLCVPRLSAALVLTVPDGYVLYFREERFQQPVPFQRRGKYVYVFPNTKTAALIPFNNID